MIHGRRLLQPFLIAIFIGFIIIYTTPVTAAVGDLLVSPTRIVFGTEDRAATVTLINTGTEQATYRISFIQLRMNEDGSMQEIEDPEAEENLADQLIRFSPRQITLPPGVPQTVRMQLRKPAELSAGEYRSHMLFRAVPAEPDLENLDSEETFSIQFTPIYGVSIPVIVRHGSTTAKANISDLNLNLTSEEDDQPVLSFNINREGNRSVYGNLTVLFIADDGTEHVVGRLNGLAVYTTINLRRLQLNLYIPPDIEFTDGSLQISYREQTGELLAETEIEIP